MLFQTITILTILYATFSLGFITASSNQSQNHHLKLFMLVYLIFYINEFSNVISHFVLIPVAGPQAFLLPLILQGMDLLLDALFYGLFLHFLNSFYGIISVRKILIILILYMVSFGTKWIYRLPLNTDIARLIKNLSSLPLLLYIIGIGIQTVRKISNKTLQMLFIISLFTLLSVIMTILVDGILEHLTSIDLPKDIIMVCTFSTLALIYIIRFQKHIKVKSAGLPELFVNRYNITKREEEIIHYLIKGFSYKNIAETLFISMATVKTHVHNIYVKTGESSRFQLINRIDDYHL